MQALQSIQELQEITIDEEFKLILPALDELTYAWLEDNILQHGCREPLVLWNGILIDGHNRYEITMRHGLDFKTVDMEFDSRDDVIIWIISTQVSRRNLTPMQLSYYRGLHYTADKKSHGDNRRFPQHSPSVQSAHLEGSTAKRLAEKYNVSSDTIRRDAQVADVISAIGRESPEAKRKILSGEANISRKQLRELSAGSDNEITEIAESINEGLTEKRRVSSPAWDEGDGITDRGDSEMRSLDAVFTGFADSVHGELHDLSGKYTLAELKAALRVFIDTLEALYGQM
jgi:hypothetical protein